MDTPPPIEEIKHQFAVAYLVTESGKVVGQQRDDKPGIDNPGKIGAFGGTIESGESPVEAVCREVTQEETNLVLNKDDFKPLINLVLWRELTQEWEVAHFFYVKIKDKDLHTLEVYEGQDWAYIDGYDDPNTIDIHQPAAQLLFTKLKA